jgi:molybdopterin synthase sulfur carrier subunit
LRVRYFAWVRERIGREEEEIDPPADVVTAGDLVRWLKGRDEQSGYAFERPDVIRVAIDQMHVQPGTAIAGAREIALFPPMTGG